MQSLVESERASFYFATLFTLNSRGTAAQRQIFYISYLMRHKGISRSGLELLANVKVGLPTTTFDRELIVHEAFVEMELK